MVIVLSLIAAAGSQHPNAQAYSLALQVIIPIAVSVFGFVAIYLGISKERGDASEKAFRERELVNLHYDLRETRAKAGAMEKRAEAIEKQASSDRRELERLKSGMGGANLIDS